MDLSTKYLGFDLPHPFIVGASYLTEDLGRVRQMEDAGAAAVVLPSLFEEHVVQDQMATLHHLLVHDDSHGEAQSYLPKPVDDMKAGVEPYLENLLRMKATLGIPVVASLNGTTDGGWLDFAKLLQQAGADALELNIYIVAADMGIDGAHAEQRVLDIVHKVKSEITIPVAVKLSPYFSAFANLAHQLDELGADGLVLFNRFFQPDIDIESQEIKPLLKLSNPTELPLRLAWLGMLSGRVKASLAVTGGVHQVEDAVKAVMSGADAIQMVSALLIHGPQHLGKMRGGLAWWLEERGFDSLAQAKGSMSLLRSPDPSAYQRQNYMKMVQSWRP
ncbi:MAG TPA: dihydroorotate dehydrogenase-like protein [Azospirillaceae bacterium]|nr:dihydroorotate dehydrogenase-like protein [Azospirillaceae bacterium]